MQGGQIGPPYRRVLDKEALGYDCPRCGSEPGTRCRYLASQKKTDWDKRAGYTTRIVHRQGSFTKITHKERRDAARAQDLWEWQQAQPRVPDRQRTIDALMEFDRREHMALRGWLRKHGEILWKDARPDGTWRGEPYW